MLLVDNLHETGINAPRKVRVGLNQGAEIPDHAVFQLLDFHNGMRVTHGCIRMYPEDIERLFEDIPVGTPVQIINQPVKLGWLAGSLFIEIHPPLEEEAESTSFDLQTALDFIAEFTVVRPAELNVQALKLALANQDGVPTIISR